MKELKEYRQSLIKRLEVAANSFRTECLATKDPYAPLNPDGWNVHQIAVHTRDVDKLVYGWRARRTAIEDDPEFQSFDGDADMAKHYDSKESLDVLLHDFVESVQSLIDLLRSLPTEAWSRVSHHTTLGHSLTLQSWVEKDLAHIKEHLETVKKQNRK